MKLKLGINSMISAVLIVAILGSGVYFYNRYLNRVKVLEQMVVRLNADSRVAEILVTGVAYDEETRRNKTTIKFLEYDVDGNPLKPKYYTFLGNIIQFQSLVIRFDDNYIQASDRLRGKSAFVFWKVFMLDGKNTQEFEITPLGSIPEGYKIPNLSNFFEAQLWQKFWKLALDPDYAKRYGIKNVQIEAPGSIFVPGNLYTVKIEHDGGLRIDSMPLPSILKGETIPQ